MPSKPQIILRPAGRVLLVDEQDRIVLLRVETVGASEPVLWLTPGGGCADNETPEQAARRELWEETGIRADTLGPCVWRRRHVCQWNNHWYDVRETFFVLRVWRAGEVVRRERRWHQERIRECRWWSVQEMREAVGEVFVPRKLPELLEPLLAGQYPVEPLEVGV